MKKCPNCGRATARTEDWACQWCGYPLLNTGYKKIPKTFRQLQEERGVLRQPALTEEEPEEAPAELAAEPAPKRVPPRRQPPPEMTREVITEHEAEETPPAVAEAEEVPVSPVAQPQQLTEPEEEKEGEKEEEEVTVTEAALPEPEPVTELEAKGAEPEVVKEVTAAPELAGVPEAEPVREIAEEEPPGEETTMSPPTPAPVTEIDASAEIIELKVRDLSTLYNKDKAAAGARLTGKTVKVTGIVDRAVVNSGLDIYYVLLTSNEPKSWNIRCTFNPEHGSELRGLVKGREATIQGDYAGYERNILLKNCFLV